MFVALFLLHCCLTFSDAVKTDQTEVRRLNLSRRLKGPLRFTAAPTYSFSSSPAPFIPSTPSHSTAAPSHKTAVRTAAPSKKSSSHESLPPVPLPSSSPVSNVLVAPTTSPNVNTTETSEFSPTFSPTTTPFLTQVCNAARQGIIWGKSQPLPINYTYEVLTDPTDAVQTTDLIETTIQNSLVQTLILSKCDPPTRRQLQDTESPTEMVVLGVSKTSSSLEADVCTLLSAPDRLNQTCYRVSGTQTFFLHEDSDINVTDPTLAENLYASVKQVFADSTIATESIPNLYGIAFVDSTTPSTTDRLPEASPAGLTDSNSASNSSSSVSFAAWIIGLIAVAGLVLVAAFLLIMRRRWDFSGDENTIAVKDSPLSEHDDVVVNTDTMDSASSLGEMGAETVLNDAAKGSLDPISEDCSLEELGVEIEDHASVVSSVTEVSGVDQYNFVSLRPISAKNITF